MLRLPDLSVPSILRTPTRGPSRHTPRTPSSNRLRTPCYRTTPSNQSDRRTPLSNRVLSPRPPRTPCRDFPSPLFCSSPTLAVPVLLGTPISTPHCPSPIRIRRISRTQLASSCSEETAAPTQGEYVEDAGLDCVVKIVGRRLFESGYSPSSNSPEKCRSKAKDEVWA